MRLVRPNVSFKESLENKILWVKRWLMKSASYHSLPLSKDEALETARYYAAKLDIHRLIHIKRTSDTRSEYTFRVRVGKPRFRGTVNYTLLPHSLVLNT